MKYSTGQLAAPILLIFGGLIGIALLEGDSIYSAASDFVDDKVRDYQHYQARSDRKREAFERRVAARQVSVTQSPKTTKVSASPELCTRMAGFAKEIWLLREQGYSYSDLDAHAQRLAGGKNEVHGFLNLIIRQVITEDADTATEARAAAYRFCRSVGA